MGPDEVGKIARATVDKAAGEAATTSIQYATVVGVDLTEGTVPYITVSPDGPGQGTIVATSLIGGFFFEGMRVAIMWSPPAACCIIGTPESQTVPFVRASRGCTEPEPEPGG